MCSDAAESQAAPGQSLKRLEGDLASWLLMIQSIGSTFFHCSKLHEKTCVSMNIRKSYDGSKGHKTKVLCSILDDCFGANFR